MAFLTRYPLKNAWIAVADNSRLVVNICSAVYFVLALSCDVSAALFSTTALSPAVRGLALVAGLPSLASTPFTIAS